VPETLHILRYDYVPDIVERRAPHRAGHLELIKELHDAGRLVLAGAVGDPPSGGLLVFRDADEARAFVDRDPYVAAGLVTDWSVEPWTVVTPTA
jgi:uncharacterized protein YciI